MASGEERKFRHFILQDLAQTDGYESPQQGRRRKAVPGKNRAEQSARLLGQLQAVKADLAMAVAAQEAAGLDDGLGIPIEFESFPDIELAFESLAREASGIELLNVRHIRGKTLATVFVPDGKLELFERRISEYLEEKKDSIGRARDHQRLIDAIEAIRTATLEALWTDDVDQLPASDEEKIWWEVWLPGRRDQQQQIDRFRDLAQLLGLQVAPGEVQFPERSVLLLYSSAASLKQSMLILNSIAELRRAKETADFFDELEPGEQSEWVDELLSRTTFPAPQDKVPTVCILDTGVNRGHPLLSLVLEEGALHTVEPAWGVGDDHQAIAAAGGLSPFSTTSRTWNGHWPLKPDVLMEGGNAARDGLGAVWTPGLSLLTTHHDPTERHFITANATSAATSLAARMAARLMGAYPELWPETIRGLIVHSADWTEEMLSRFLPSNPAKDSYSALVRICGFGVPSLERAEWSVDNSLTMLAQGWLHPFEREGNNQPKLRDMHLYELPWPRQSLGELGETLVDMRVTLSYFVEPSPSARGPRSRYRYESHGLRFDVQRSYESVPDFRSRVNAAARDEEAGVTTRGADPNWLLGKPCRPPRSIACFGWLARSPTSPAPTGWAPHTSPKRCSTAASGWGGDRAVGGSGGPWGGSAGGGAAAGPGPAVGGPPRDRGGRPMTEGEAQAALAVIALELVAITDRLQQVHGALPPSRNREAMLEHRVPYDVATELAGTVECVVADQLRPAMENLEAASRVTAEELREQQALLRRLRGRMRDEIG